MLLTLFVRRQRRRRHPSSSSGWTRRDLWGADLTPRDVRELLPGLQTVVVKDGAVAALALTTEATHRVPALRTTVGEPVGAGDAFVAGYLAGYLAGLVRGASPTHAPRLGHVTAVSALKVTGDHGRLADPEERRLLYLSDETWESSV
ncbi:PfkB family carbohydrate kinase [Streptomyces sp. NPDC057877]|uniref:PfkB family carbohydrate kinase n=1 Tax=Streptomyces sp. NPDC057877 TaxID=3346269 RepID=UPI003690E82E